LVNNKKGVRLRGSSVKILNISFRLSLLESCVQISKWRTNFVDFLLSVFSVWILGDQVHLFIGSFVIIT